MPLNAPNRTAVPSEEQPLFQRPDAVHMTSVHAQRDVRIFQKMAKGLAHAGFKVCLVSTGKVDEVVDGVQLLVVPELPESRSLIPGGHVMKRALVTGFRVFRRTWATKAKIIHYHDAEMAPWALLLKLFGGRVIIKDIHDNLSKQMYGKHYIPDSCKRMAAGIAWAVERCSSLWADVVVAATPSIASCSPPRKTVLVQNYPLPGELLARSPIPYRDRSMWVAYVGYITRIRAACQMVEAMAQVTAPGGPRLKMAGPIAPASLPGALAALPGFDRVDTVGVLSRAEVADMLATCRVGLILYLPSPNHVDAQPNKLFEYMSAAIPVVASDFPLWRQIVAGTGCGLLVDPLDPGAIAQAVDWLLTHPEEAEAMGCRGRLAVETQYNWTTEEAKLHAIYTRLLCR